MQLCYRGVSYQTNNNQAETRNFNTVNAKYRGVEYQIISHKPRLINNNLTLKYRGVTYKTNEELTTVNSENHFGVDRKHFKSPFIYFT